MKRKIDIQRGTTTFISPIEESGEEKECIISIVIGAKK